MYTDSKVRLNPAISEEADKAIRKVVFDHRGSNIGSILEDMIEHCSKNRAFLDKTKAKYSPKKEEEIDY